MRASPFHRDVDSDGDEIPPLEPDDPTDFQYSLWFTVEIDVQAPDAQAVVELAAPCLVRERIFQRDLLTRIGG